MSIDDEMYKRDLHKICAELARLRKVEAAGVEVLHEWDNAAFTVTSTRKAVEKLRSALASKPEETP
jgi:hypothetical protein